jgi:hypothetical protein
LLFLSWCYNQGMTRPYGTIECTIENCKDKHKAQGYCNKHYIRYLHYGDPRVAKIELKEIPLEEWFWNNVEKTNTCWIWKGTMQKKSNYGVVSVNHKTKLAHRLSYEFIKGPIPMGYEVDHLCHSKECKLSNLCPHRRCVNPAHLEAVTKIINIQRGNAGGVLGAKLRKKPTCKHGHPFTPENTHISSTTGERVCITCRRAKDVRRRKRLREERIANGEIVKVGPKPATYCKRGHEYTPDNVYVTKSQRYCKTCLQAKQRRYKTRKSVNSSISK